MYRKKDRKNRNPLFELFKPDILVFVLLTGVMGYFQSQPVEAPVDISKLILFCFGLLGVSGGSFALNQVQEWRIDQMMPRTQHRPIASGRMSPQAGLFFGLAVGVFGLVLSYLVSPLVMALGLFTAVLYNVFYTIIWKRKWAFGAVPGAIPGAMPVVIGYAANSTEIWAWDSVYMFLIMFLWQMPHFWALAIRYKDDYEMAGVPVLPIILGIPRTLFHIGLYMVAYVATALAAPLFFSAKYAYFFLIVPFALKVFWEYLKYRKNEGGQGWLPFFMWVNFSLLAFLLVPVLERWVPWP